jgi:hypothetical protein
MSQETIFGIFAKDRITLEVTESLEGLNNAWSIMNGVLMSIGIVVGWPCSVLVGFASTPKMFD